MKANETLLLSMLCGLALLTSGCIDISTRLQPEDTAVKASLEGSNCVPIIFGLGFGTASIEEAKADGHTTMSTRSSAPTGLQGGGMTQTIRAPITKVRRVELTDRQFLFFGSRCVEVTGE